MKYSLLVFFVLSLNFVRCKLTLTQQIQKHNQLNFNPNYELTIPKLNFTQEDLDAICKEIKQIQSDFFSPHVNNSRYLYSIFTDQRKKNDSTLYFEYLLADTYLWHLKMNKNYEDSIQHYVGNKKKQAEFYEYEILVTPSNQKYYIRNHNIIKHNGLYFLVVIDKDVISEILNIYNKYGRVLTFNQYMDYYIGVFIWLLPDSLPDNCFCDK